MAITLLLRVQPLPPVPAADDDVRVVDNKLELRYELWVGEERVGFIAYRREPAAIVLVHTDVDPRFEGRGLGSRLLASVLQDIRSRELKLVPLCPFVAAYLRRHPEDSDLVVSDPAVGD